MEKLAIIYLFFLNEMTFFTTARSSRDSKLDPVSSADAWTRILRPALSNCFLPKPGVWLERRDERLARQRDALDDVVAPRVELETIPQLLRCILLPLSLTPSKEHSRRVGQVCQLSLWRDRTAASLAEIRSPFYELSHSQTARSF